MTFVSGVFLLRGGASSQLNPTPAAVQLWQLIPTFSFTGFHFYCNSAFYSSGMHIFQRPHPVSPTPSPPPGSMCDSAYSRRSLKKCRWALLFARSNMSSHIHIFETASRFKIFIACVFQAKKREKAAAASSQKETTGTFLLITKTYGFTC
jgi:hypothetical protein